jgi:hypothetical protein
MKGARPSGGSKRELVRRADGGGTLHPLDAAKSMATSASYGVSPAWDGGRMFAR